MENVFIYDCVRTPRGKGKRDGSLHTVKPIDLISPLLKAIRERNNFSSHALEDVMLGCVTQVGEQGGCVAKAAVLQAGFDQRVSGSTVNRFCGSGLEAVNMAAAKVASKQHDLIIAGGVEAMSRVKMGSDGGALMIDPELSAKVNFVPQGISADLIATLNNYSRNDLDTFAYSSHQKAAKAQEEGRFKKSLIPIKDKIGRALLNYDEMVRPSTTVEKLSELKAAFLELGEKYSMDAIALEKYSQLEKINHFHHAGNSSSIVDGASAVLIGNEIARDRFDLRPRAKIRSVGLISCEPTIMLTGPAPASEMALKKAGLSIKDIDLIEINEAFASVVLNFIDELKVDPDKVNVNGGAIALGHPLGATGAMLVGTIVDELERADKNLGLVTLCIGGGMGIATIIERV